MFTPEWLVIVSSPSWYESAGCSQKHFCELFCILSDIVGRVEVLLGKSCMEVPFCFLVVPAC